MDAVVADLDADLPKGLAFPLPGPAYPKITVEQIDGLTRRPLSAGVRQALRFFVPVILLFPGVHLAHS